MCSPKRLWLALAVLALCAPASFADLLLVPSGDYPTIQEALDDAQDGDEIYLDDGTYDTTTEPAFPLDFNGHNCLLTSASGDPTAVTIDAGASGSVFIFQTGENAGAQIVAVTITNGSATGDGGGILIDEASPTLSNISITNCLATGDGGGIACINGAAPTISECSISSCIAGAGLDNSGNGGGIACKAGSNPSITGSTIAGNAAQSNTLVLSNAKGGGIYCDASGPTIDTNSITDNTADDSGAGIACEAASAATIYHNYISTNAAANNGGGILCDGSSPQITDQIALDDADAFPGTFTSNSAGSGNGGAIFCTNGSTPTIDNNEFLTNTAGGDGGAIACDNSSPSITANTVKANTAGGNGGGIAASNGSSPDIHDNTIGGSDALLDRNQAQGGSGGGVFVSGAASSATIRNNVIGSNTSAASGGGIYTGGAPVIASNTIFGNSTGGDGGGIMCVGIIATPAEINHNLIHGNTAGNTVSGGSGGAIAANLAYVNVVNNTIAENTANRVSPNGGIGGGVYATNGSVVTITNSILWGDTGTAISGSELGVNTFVQASTLSVDYSDVQGGQSAIFTGVGNTIIWGLNNIDEDPLFVSLGDYHLMSQGGSFAGLFGLPPTDPLAWVRDIDHSPCIDSGDGSPFANELAPNGNRINMGVYGNTNEASKSAPIFQAIVTSAPAKIKYNRKLKITWILIGVIKGDKITANRIEWGTSPFSMIKVTGTVKKVVSSTSITSPKIPGVVMYYRVHAVVNGRAVYSNIGQIIVNPF